MGSNKVSKVAFVVAIVASMLIPISSAHASLMAGTANNQCSLPYVTEVNAYGKHFVATVEVIGKPTKVKAFIGKKHVKIDRIGKHTWMLPMKKGKLYTIKAKSAKSNWKVIQYRIARL